VTLSICVPSFSGFSLASCLFLCLHAFFVFRSFFSFSRVWCTAAPGPPLPRRPMKKPAGHRGPQPPGEVVHRGSRGARSPHLQYPVYERTNRKMSPSEFDQSID